MANKDIKAIKVIDSNETIVLSRAFAKAAQYYGTPEFNKLLAVRKLFPTYTVTVEAEKKHHRTTTISPTYAFIEDYIMRHNPSKMADYQALRASSDEAQEKKGKAKSYGAIRKWFLREFPEFNEFRDKQNAILNGNAA